MTDDSFDFNAILQKWAAVYARRTIQDFLKFAHQNDLSMPQINVLMRLHYRGPATINDLRKELYGSRAAATQMIDSLVRAGLVERAEALKDRREKMVSLTSHGRQLVENGMAARRQWQDQLSNMLSPDERQKISAVFLKMIQVALDLEKPNEPRTAETADQDE